MLVDDILRKLNHRLGKPFQQVSTTALEQLMHYDWPGNIRELQNVLERAAIVGTPPTLQVPALSSPPSATRSPQEPVIATLREAEKQHIEQALQATNGMIAGKQGAAALLDLPPSTLRSKIKKLGIRS